MSTSNLRTPFSFVPLGAFAFNHDRSQAALSPRSNLLYIVDCSLSVCDISLWKLAHTLSGHERAITCIAWHPISGHLLSCAEDRIAFVWRNVSEPPAEVASNAEPQRESCWPRQWVVGDCIKAGLTCCAWSPYGEKVYLGSAASTVAVGRYVAQEGWWVCRVVEAHSGIVTVIAPHPSYVALVATGSTDTTVRLFSSLLKKVDGKADNAAPLGHVYGIRQLHAWVRALSWSPSGRYLAVATHDSRVHLFSSPAGTFSDVNAFLVSTVSLPTLPLLSLDFIHDYQLVGGGFGGSVVLLERHVATSDAHPSSHETWQYVNRLNAICDSRPSTFPSSGPCSSAGLPEVQHTGFIRFVVTLQGEQTTTIVSMPSPVVASIGENGLVLLWTLGESAGGCPRRDPD